MMRTKPSTYSYIHYLSVYAVIYLNHFQQNVTCIATWKHLSISFGGCCMGRFARNQRLLPFWIQERQSCGKSNAIIVILFGEGFNAYFTDHCGWFMVVVWFWAWDGFTVVYHIRGVHGTCPFERMNSTWLRWLDRIAHLVVGWFYHSEQWWCST